MSNLFEKATRHAYRFSIGAGQLTVEDVWKLPLTSAKGVSLDSLAIALDTEMRSSQRSFVSDVPASQTLSDKFEIVKHIISVRLAENASQREAQARQQLAERAGEILEQRRQAELANLSTEELEKLAKGQG